MRQYIKLFKALPVKKRTKKYSERYISDGVLIEKSVKRTFSKSELTSLLKDLVPSYNELNMTFHKSWKKVRDASQDQLIAEQVLHYFSTYGLQEAGLYSNETVYIPCEQLSKEKNKGITFFVINGITKSEMSSRLNKLLSSGIALSEDDISNIIFVVKEQKLTIDVNSCSNREVKTRLYDELNIVPECPVEYLRLQLFKVTGSTLLIKNAATISNIKNSLPYSQNVFRPYEKSYGLARLAEIFLRYKPIFLAFKNKSSSHTVNRIRKLAVKFHKPQQEDYMTSVTKHLRNGTFSSHKLKNALKNATIFRKLKLAQALSFYGSEHDNVLYTVRTGKSFVTEAKPTIDTKKALAIVKNSICNDISHLNGKNIYLDSNLTVPTSGKMFVGDVPFGSSFKTSKSFALGVSWKDNEYTVDLDLSLISLNGKTGWDSSYRNADSLFSGDITAAPNGATEAHLIRGNARDGVYVLSLNYYNANNRKYYSSDLGDSDELVVPYTVFVTAEDEYNTMKFNSMVSKNNMLFYADSKITSNKAQKDIGILKIEEGVKTFYLFEHASGNTSTSYLNDKSRMTISYYDSYLKSLLDVKTLFQEVGANIVTSPSKADIDLSTAALTKEKLISTLLDT